LQKKIEVKTLLVLFITPLAGFFMGYMVKDLKRISRFLLTFSGAYLISLVFLHILPDIYAATGAKTGLFVLIGFFLQVLIDYSSKGIEHGHVHISHKTGIAGVLIGLYFHAFLEGIPLGIGQADDYSETGPLLLGIVLHKIPVSIVLTTLLISRYSNTRKIFFQLLLFAIIAPLGYLYGYYFSGETLFSFEEIMAVVVGIFLHVGTTIIFESSDTHKINLEKLVAILAGFVVSAFLIG